MNTLTKIVAQKRKFVQEQKELYPTKLLEKSIYFDSKTVSLKKYLLRKDKQGIIAEIKKQSPSEGIINKYINVEKLSIGYMQSGASALSVLTDTPFFGGSNDDLMIARNHNFCPILRKDFIIDEYQIIESKAIGADAILLIASVLTKTEIEKYTLLANSLGLEVLFEIHNEKELVKTNSNHSIIGVNNRNLNSLNINSQNAEEMFNHIKDFEVKVAESGLNKAETIYKLKQIGYNGFLIGTYFMRNSIPQNTCKELIEQLNNLKPC